MIDVKTRQMICYLFRVGGEWFQKVRGLDARSRGKVVYSGPSEFAGK
jgi:hypothetical protein